ncbi:hypothetical protein HZI73_00910 [Vallitalea pronyensis]|uniref:Uncharacterized protein n=1 Tax=Vallitalea pronyensis TaxID=1348613 RepID=A0A8J8MFQ3_9FIRM|nr:DUF5711 family protein [Vallitalea pronyensis]QUI20942.1 hypothetical protein HZI73_00910 [Vallitalea pronyensis]
MKKQKMKIFLIMVAVIASLVAYIVIIRPKGYGLIGGKVKFEVMNTTAINPLDKVSLRQLGKHIVRISKDGVTMLDYEGKTIWDKTFNMMNPKVISNEKFLAVGDISSRDVYLFNEEGFVRQYDVNDPIIMYDINENGIVAIIGQNDKGHVVQLYDADGTALVHRETFLENDGFPLALDISEDGTKMVTSYLFVKGETVVSNLTFFNFSDTGQKFDERVTGAFAVDDTLIPEVKFLDGNHVSAVGDNRVLFYQVDIKPEEVANVTLNNEIKKVSYANNNLLTLLGRPLSGESTYQENTLVAYDNAGQVAYENAYESAITYLEGSHEKYYVESEFYIREYYNGKINWETPLKEDIKFISSLGRNKFLIVLQNEYRVVKVIK